MGINNLQKALNFASKKLCWCELEIIKEPITGTGETEEKLIMFHPMIPKNMCYAYINHENGSLYANLIVNFNSKEFPAEDFFCYFNELREDILYL